MAVRGVREAAFYQMLTTLAIRFSLLGIGLGASVDLDCLSGPGFEFSLEWCGLVIHPAHPTWTIRSRFFFLGQLSHQCFSGEHESGD